MNVSNASATQWAEWGESPLEPRRDPEIEAYVKSVLGFVPRSYLKLAHCPWLVRAAADSRRLGLVHVDFELGQFVSLAVSQDNSCLYCYDSVRAQLRLSGLPEGRIRRLEQDWFAADLDPHVKVGLEFARRLSRSNPVLTRADTKPLRDAGYEEGAIRELAFVASGEVIANRVSTISALPMETYMRIPDRWYFRLLAPLLRRRAQSADRRGQPEFLSPGLETGPYSHVVRALDGLPAAAWLRRSLDAAWDSPILSRRAKGLVFAVVAHALGCDRSEGEARRLLAEEGLEGGLVDEILAHLASPGLDEIESAIVPFARETVRYQAPRIQQKARELRPRLSAAQFVELVGVVAMANSVCRLGFLADAA
jgi:AhpD family alkylhydroperoxidase